MLRRAARRLLIGFVFLAAALPVLAWSILPAALRAGAFRETISAILSERLGCPVRVESVDLPEAATLVARGVSLDHPAPGVESAAVEFVRVRFARVAPWGEPVEVIVEGLDARVAWKRGAASPPIRTTSSRPARWPRLVLARARVSGTVEGRAFEIPVLEAAARPVAADRVELVADGLIGEEPLKLRGRADLGPKPSLTITELRAGALQTAISASAGGLSAVLEPCLIPPALGTLVKELTGLEVRGTVSAQAQVDVAGGIRIRLTGELREAAVGPASGSPRYGVTADRTERSWNGTFDVGPLDVELPGGRRLRIGSLRGRGTRSDDGTVSATVAFSEVSGRESGFSLSGLGGVAEISGSWPEAEVTVRLEQGTLSKGTLREALAGIRISGRFNAGGSVKGGRVDWPGLASLAVEGGLKDGRISFDPIDLAAAGPRIRAWIPGLPEVRGRMGASVELREGWAQARLRLDGVGLTAGSLQLKELSGELPLIHAWGAIPQVQARGKIRWSGLSFPVEGLGERTFDVEAEPDRLRFAAAGFQLTLARRADAMSATVDLHDWPAVPGMRVGSASVEAKLREKRLDVKARFNGVSLARDGLEIAGVEGTASASAAGSAVALELRLSKAEVLAGETYADLEGAVLEIRAAGRREGGAWRLDEGVATLSDLGSVRAQGVWAGKTGWASVETSELPIDALLRRAESIFGVKGVTGGGTARLVARLQGSSAEGTLTLMSVEAHAGRAALAGLTGELPFILGSPAAPPRRGWIAFENLSAGGVLELGPRKLSVTARPDALSMDTPLSVELWGGEVRIEDVEIIGLRTGWRAGATVQALGLDLRRATATIEGTVDIPSGRLIATSERVILDPPIRATLFGGRAEVRNLRLVQPLDAIRRAAQFGFRLQGVRLRPAFRAAMGHGVMDGVLDARGEMEVHGSGKPNWFRLEASTREVEGVPQELDLAAVKKLARQLGTDPTSLDPLGIRTFSYDRLGIYAVLDPNWILYVRGKYYVPREGPDAGRLMEYPVEDLMGRKVAPGDPVEYLIKGRTPSIFGQLLGKHGEVNVINSRPGNGTDFDQVWRNLGKVSLGDPVKK